MKQLFLLLFCLAGFVKNIPAQSNCGKLEEYYPEPWDQPVAIRVKLHIIQYSENDPRNYTIKDTGLLRQQIDLINRFYGNLLPPTLNPPGQTGFIPDSRIQFIIKGIHFYIDSTKWDRIKRGPYKDNTYPSAILSVSEDRKTVSLKGSHVYRFKKGTEAVLVDGGKNSGTYIVENAVFDRDRRITNIVLNRPLSADEPTGKLTYMSENNHNCDHDIFRDLLKEDKNYLHIIYTGSSMKAIPFGCGPSPYFLNVSNYRFGGDWANAQLSAHELGHCMGLNHTDFPQFDDLPKKDRFGFVDCDSIDVSNNIMGYNKCRSYLSPKQIAHVHKEYSNNPGKIRTLVFCEYSSENSVYVTRNETWDGARVIGGDLVIRKNKTLTINCMVSMPDGGNIILENNAKLIVNGSVITNNCDSKWDGLMMCKKFRGDKLNMKTPKRKGKIEFINGGKLENMKIKP